MHPTRVPVQDVLIRLPCILLPSGVLLALTYLFPAFALTGPLALAAYWMSESGSKFGMPLIAITMIALVVKRPGLSGRERAAEVLAISLALAIVLGGGAYLNEHVVKPLFAVPRPNIIELADNPSHPGALKMSVAGFYALPTKEARSAHLEENVLTAEFGLQFGLHEQVRRHWIAETGYSFPSGHSFSSMLLATFFLGMGLGSVSGRRLWAFYLLVFWAVLVCVSRTILRVHSPTDICVGGLEGILAGVLTYLLTRRLIGPFALSACRSHGDVT